MSLQTFLAEAEERAVAAEAARHAEQVRLAEELANYLAELLGDVWQDLQPHAAPDRHVHQLDIYIHHPELEPFSIRRSHNGCVAFTDHAKCEFGDGHLDGFGVFLLERRQARAKQRERELEKLVSDCSAKLRDGDTDANAAREAHHKLCEVRPYDRARWDALLADYGRHQTEILATRQAREEREAAEQAALGAYERACADYGRRHQVAIAENRKRLAILEAAHDEPFQTWTLTYAVVALDDTDERVLETNTVEVLSDKPDAEGYWVVPTSYGRRRVRYRHVVSTEGPHERRPNAERYTRDFWVPQAQWMLRLNPQADRADCDRILARAQWVALPQPPSPPADLPTHARAVVETCARQAAEAEGSGKSPNPQA